jgi:hypothetical protein
LIGIKSPASGTGKNCGLQFRRAAMPIKDVFLLCFFVGVFCLFGGVLAYGDWRDAQHRKTRGADEHKTAR